MPSSIDSIGRRSSSHISEDFESFPGRPAPAPARPAPTATDAFLDATSARIDADIFAFVNNAPEAPSSTFAPPGRATKSSTQANDRILYVG